MSAFITLVPLHSIRRPLLSSHCKKRPLQMAIPSPKALDIASVGNISVDILLPITRHPIQVGEHQPLTSPVRLEMGGSLNALVSARRLGCSVAPIAFTTAKHPDEDPSKIFVSKFISESSRELAFDTSALLPRFGAFVPTCGILADKMGRHTFLASNEDLVPQLDQSTEYPDEMSAVVRSAKVLIVDGFALHSDRYITRKCVETAVLHGTKVWFDPQSAIASFVASKDELFHFVLRNAHGLSLTLDEARIATGMDAPEAIVRDFSDRLCPQIEIVLLKDGPKGSQAFRRDGHGMFERHVIPGFVVNEEEYVDSVGAGDSFLGAFLAASIVHELDIVDCLTLANAMGSATCRNLGAGRMGVGSLKAVRKIIANNACSSLLQILTCEKLAETI